MIAKIVSKNLIEIYDKTQFDIDAILHSGQVFRHFETEEGYDLVAGQHVARIISAPNKVMVQCDDAQFFWDYFDLGTDYSEIKKYLMQYDVVARIVSAGNAGGIRILRGDFIEIVISFIISANNNIRRFTRTLNALAEQFGTRTNYDRHAFPTLKQLSRVSEQDFKRLGCGYRSAYLVRAIKQLQELDMAEITKMTDEDLIKRLTQITGVGRKVASCIALFAGDFHRLDVVPVDIWVQKAITSIDGVSDMFESAKLAGVAQQYLYYYLQYLKGTL